MSIYSAVMNLTYTLFACTQLVYELKNVRQRRPFVHYLTRIENKNV